MTDLKISDLPDAGALQNSDLIPIVRTQGTERITAKVTAGSLAGGGGNWNPSAKYEFGNTYFSVKNMGLGGSGNQILVDEAPGINTIGLFTTSDQDPNSSFLKVYQHLVALGVNGYHNFTATESFTRVLHKDRVILQANDSNTTLRTYGGQDAFLASFDRVTLRVQDYSVFSAFADHTALYLQRKPVFSAIDTTTTLFRDNKPVFSAGQNLQGQNHTGVFVNGKTVFEAGDNYTELHIYNPTNDNLINLLHADQDTCKLFHKNMAVLNYGTATAGLANPMPYSALNLVDDRGTTNISKKVLEASPTYTSLYYDNKRVLDFKKNSFVLYGIDNNETAVPLIEKHSTNTFVRFHDMSSTNTNSSVFMQASASNVTMYRDINLSSANKDIQLGTGTWGSTQNLKGILNNLVTRIAALEAKI